MSTTDDVPTTQTPIVGVYVIYSADILGSSREIDGMGPFREAPTHGAYARPMSGHWVETEGDEQYDYGYLGDESGDARYYPAGAFDAQGIETVDTILEENPDDPRGDSCNYYDERGLPMNVIGEGRHRKWVAELSLEEWRGCAEMLCIDLNDDGMPEDYSETMGSLTEYGCIDAICVENTEGWNPSVVIDSNLYVSFAYDRADAKREEV